MPNDPPPVEGGGGANNNNNNNNNNPQQPRNRREKKAEEIQGLDEIVPLNSGKLAGYDIGKAIGSGKFSVVYRAKELNTGKHVALKKIQIFDIMDSKSRNKCLREVKLLQSLSQHPNLIQYLDAFIEENELIIVFEWAEHGDLRKMLRHLKTPLDEPMVWMYFTQVCGAVAHMHEQRIMHRDIKPANIFLTSQTVLKLGDLGLGRSLSDQSIEAFSKVGTPLYMSPEVLHGQGYDFKSDVWSLGCLLYELAMMRSPFEGENQTLYDIFKKINTCEYPPVNDSFSPELQQLVSRMIQTDPKTRPDVFLVFQFCQQQVMKTKMEQSVFVIMNDIYSRLSILNCQRFCCATLGLPFLTPTQFSEPMGSPATSSTTIAARRRKSISDADGNSVQFRIFVAVCYWLLHLAGGGSVIVGDVDESEKSKNSSSNSSSIRRNRSSSSGSSSSSPQRGNHVQKMGLLALADGRGRVANNKTSNQVDDESYNHNNNNANHHSHHKSPIKQSNNNNHRYANAAHTSLSTVVSSNNNSSHNGSSGGASSSNSSPPNRRQLSSPSPPPPVAQSPSYSFASEGWERFVKHHKSSDPLYSPPHPSVECENIVKLCQKMGIFLPESVAFSKLTEGYGASVCQLISAILDFCFIKIQFSKPVYQQQQAGGGNNNDEEEDDFIMMDDAYTAQGNARGKMNGDDENDEENVEEAHLIITRNTADSSSDEDDDRRDDKMSAAGRYSRASTAVLRTGGGGGGGNGSAGSSSSRNSSRNSFRKDDMYTTTTTTAAAASSSGTPLPPLVSFGSSEWRSRVGEAVDAARVFGDSLVESEPHLQRMEKNWSEELATLLSRSRRLQMECGSLIDHWRACKEELEQNVSVHVQSQRKLALKMTELTRIDDEIGNKKQLMEETQQALSDETALKMVKHAKSKLRREIAGLEIKLEINRKWRWEEDAKQRRRRREKDDAKSRAKASDDDGDSNSSSNSSDDDDDF